MSIESNTSKKIKHYLIDVMRRKFDRYNPETKHMPFHYRLLGKDRYAMFSFIHSINTTFGMSIFEQVAEILANGAGYVAERQFKLYGDIDQSTEKLINDIHYGIRKGNRKSSVENEIKAIRNSIKKGEAKKDPDSVIDLYVERNNVSYLFDITSAKPNKKEFVVLKKKLLRWVALKLSQNKKAIVYSKLAIPYNPYHPEPYERWTLSGLYDLEEREILIGKEFWNFVGNGDVYKELLNIFEEIGNILRPEIDEKFSQFVN